MHLFSTTTESLGNCIPLPKMLECSMYEPAGDIVLNWTEHSNNEWNAIFHESAVPDEWKSYTELNRKLSGL